MKTGQEKDELIIEKRLKKMNDTKNKQIQVPHKKSFKEQTEELKTKSE